MSPAHARHVANIILRLPAGAERVYPSTQYGMGFVITTNNYILLRADELTHQERKEIADMVNHIIKQ